MTWTRLLTLYMGHTTAAVSTVLAAFMAGLASGSAVGAWIAPRLTPLRTLYAYALLELVVVLVALVLPLELNALRPVLAWAYQDGTSSLLFPMVRLLSCLALVLIPAVALGATFPIAVRWFVGGSAHPGRPCGELYAANTAGATVGAVAAGFVLIPAMGISGTTTCWDRRQRPRDRRRASSRVRINGDQHVQPDQRDRRDRTVGSSIRLEIQLRPPERVSRFAKAMAYRHRARPYGLFDVNVPIAWTLSLSFSSDRRRMPCQRLWPPSSAASLAALCSDRGWRDVRSPTLWLGAVLARDGNRDNREPFVCRHRCSAPRGRTPRWLSRHGRPCAAGRCTDSATAVGLGVAFPLSLEIVGGEGPHLVRRLGMVYAVNTLAAVAGALAAGFVSIRSSDSSGPSAW